MAFDFIDIIIIFGIRSVKLYPAEEAQNNMFMSSSHELSHLLAI